MVTLFAPSCFADKGALSLGVYSNTQREERRAVSIVSCVISTTSGRMNETRIDDVLNLAADVQVCAALLALFALED